LILVVSDNRKYCYTYRRIMEMMLDYISSSEDIYRAALAILDTVRLEQPVRLLGVRLTGLRHHQEQLALFPDERRHNELMRSMDCINDRFGEFTVTFGSLLTNRDKGSHVISPAWRPSGIRNVEVR
jgi:DNA polymerase-4